jgi:hypothetical protein
MVTFPLVRPLFCLSSTMAADLEWRGHMSESPDLFPKVSLETVMDEPKLSEDHGLNAIPGTEKKLAGRTYIPKGHRHLRFDTPQKVLIALQDAMNDIRSARTETDVRLSTARGRALAALASVWFVGYDHFLLFEKVEAQQKQLDMLLARTQVQPPGNGIVRR